MFRRAFNSLLWVWRGRIGFVYRVRCVCNSERRPVAFGKIGSMSRVFRQDENTHAKRDQTVCVRLSFVRDFGINPCPQTDPSHPSIIRPMVLHCQTSLHEANRECLARLAVKNPNEGREMGARGLGRQTEKASYHHFVVPARLKAALC
jgi:hypothetical protein